MYSGLVFIVIYPQRSLLLGRITSFVQNNKKGPMVGINFRQFFWSFYEVENEVSHNDGTFKVLDLSQTTPPWGGRRTPSYVKKYLRLI